MQVMLLRKFMVLLVEKQLISKEGLSMIHLIEALSISLIINMVALVFKKRQPVAAMARVKNR